MTSPSAPYAASPIEEALVELRFDAATPWDPTMPGKLHEQPSIKALYGGKPKQITLLNAAVQVQGGQPRGLAVQENQVLVPLSSEDDTSILRAGSGLLSVHVMRPYPGWELFRRRVEEAIDAHRAVVGPSTLRRIGVRYVNRVPSSPGAFDADARASFRCAPPQVPDLPEELTAFLLRTHQRCPDGMNLVVTHATVEGPPGSFGLVLDLDLVWEGEEALDPDTLQRVDDMHGRISKAFEALITDEARRGFHAGGA